MPLFRTLADYLQRDYFREWFQLVWTNLSVHDESNVQMACDENERGEKILKKRSNYDQKTAMNK